MLNRSNGNLLLLGLLTGALFAAVFWLRIRYNVASDMRVAILSELRRAAPSLDLRIAALLSLGVLVACHIFLLTAFVPNLYLNYLTPVVYHNPTQQMNKLFALLIWFMYLREFWGKAHRTPLVGILLAICCILSALAKPSFLIAFLPVTGLVAGYRWLNGDWRHFRDYALAIAVASSAVLLWQFSTEYGSASEGGIRLEPFALFASAQYVLMLPLSLAFPIVTLASLWTRSSNDIGTKLAWGLMAIGLLFAFLLVEDGPNREAGNFLWTAQTGAFILYVQSLLVTAAAYAKGETRARWPLAVLGIHVLCGLIFILANVLVPDQIWR